MTDDQGRGADSRLLNYRDARDDPRLGRKSRFAFGMTVGLVVALALAAGSFALLALLTDMYNGADKGKPVLLLALLFVAAIMIGLVSLALRAHRRRKWPGFLVGTLLGIGLALWPLGMCYLYVASEALK